MFTDPYNNSFVRYVERTNGTLRCVSRTRLCLGWAIAAVVIGGCGGDQGPPRTVVAGSVTYQGAPVESGEIRFIPAKGSTGPVSVAPIVAGKYRADHRGGVVVGTERVEVYAYGSDPQYKNQPQNRQQPEVGPGVGMAGEGLRQQYLPAKYNTQSQLEITIAPGSGTITRDFTLIN